VWKIDAVRPDSASQFFSAWSRGVSENPPAAAPQSTPHDGTSFASVTHAARSLTGGGRVFAASAGMAPATAVTAPANVAVRTDIAHCILVLRATVNLPRRPAAVYGRAETGDC
jgi:hypothetical protein